MKLLTATNRTQGQRDNDFNHCVEGELVILWIVCGPDEENPDGGCGCGRAFTGLNSGLITTTAMVKELDLNRADATEAIRSAMARGGFAKFMDEQTLSAFVEEMIDLGEEFDVGAVVERRVDDVNVRV